MSIAQAVALNAGGLLDQIGDIADIASAVSSPAESHGSGSVYKPSADSVNTSFTSTYDSSTGWWTLDLERQRIGNNRTASYFRQYRYQFRNRDSVIQRDWLTGSDTAYSVDFRIVSGSGRFAIPSHSLELDTLTTRWLVTHANTGTFTLAGVPDAPYRRAGTDTITTDASARALRQELSLGAESVTSPRGSRLFLESSTVGVFSGTFFAGITFIGDSLYAERSVGYAVTITIGGGVADIAIAGNHYRASVRTGEIQ
jgi:hypothetical protein